MTQVTVYSCYTNEDYEPVNKTLNINSLQELCDIVDQFPWQREFQVMEEVGAMGGLDFVVGNEKGVHAYFSCCQDNENSFVPFLDVHFKSGFLGGFGSKRARKDFDQCSISELKVHLNDLFELSIEQLYNKYK